MTKSATEKKRIRRAPQNNGGGSRDLSDTNSSSKKQAAQKDVYQVFAEKVRDNKQLESRWAIMQEARVEYFRGKDFSAFLRNHPEIKEILGSDKDLDTEDIVKTLLMKNLIVKCDRVMKTVRPGKKKLSSWPAHLEIYHIAERSSESDSPVSTIERSELWKLARVKPNGEYINDESREIAEKIDSLTQSVSQGDIHPSGMNDILTMALGTPEHNGRVRTAGQGATIRKYFHIPRQRHASFVHNYH